MQCPFSGLAGPAPTSACRHFPMNSDLSADLLEETQKTLEARLQVRALHAGSPVLCFPYGPCLPCGLAVQRTSQVASLRHSAIAHACGLCSSQAQGSALGTVDEEDEEGGGNANADEEAQWGKGGALDAGKGQADAAAAGAKAGEGQGAEEGDEEFVDAMEEDLPEGALPPPTQTQAQTQDTAGLMNPTQTEEQGGRDSCSLVIVQCWTTTQTGP